MSLKESWQQQRQQRQQEVIQRQQAVQQELMVARQERQTKAAQRRDDLNLFRDMIASMDQSRRANFQLFQAEMQQFCLTLKTETQVFLNQASDRRHIQAQQVALQLDAFMQSLRQQTADFVAMATAERIVMADQVETELTAFVEALRADVQSYLWEMEHQRKVRAEQLQQQLQHGRMVREAEVDAMFQRFTEFRSELRQFCDNLRSQVWGNDVPVVETPKPVPSVAKPTTPKNGHKPSKKLTAIPPASGIGAFTHGDSIAVLPAQPAPIPAIENLSHEKDVYNFIHEAHGARLTQIESSLGINRFQAVDALRSLIKKGMITQRDRMYLTQEDLAHT